ncbi:MAG: T9SS type A sorting domain-containing protein, partial [Bacteroidales bacterium]|nr:T9SS type A sorting domain-containing protein [Bacteroidales bacterium]
AFEHVSNAKYMFAIDDFRLDLYTDPIINVTPLAMNFVTIFGNVSEAQSANVILANVTEDVNVAASDNFEVSADGLTFASTATLGADGGSFFVRYNPTSTGSHNGTVQISNSQIDETITLTGLARDCSGSITEFPFVEDFEGGISYCWLNIDADEDGNSWEDASGYITSFMGHGNSTNAAMSLSYDNYISSALTPDNWLITKPFEIPEGSNMELSFFVAAQDDDYAQEHYGVFVSTGSADIADFELVFEETIDANGGAKTQGAWKQKHIDLSAYAGETIYIAWRHFNCTDQYVFLLDDIYIGVPTAVEESEMTEIAVYPNPASNMLTITNAEGSKVVVVNALGQVVTEINNASANQTIDLSKFANGTYIVKANGQVVKFNVVK